MKKTILATALLSLVSFGSFAGQLVIENGNGKVALSSNADNALTVNGQALAQPKKVFSEDGTVLGQLESLTLTTSSDEHGYFLGTVDNDPYGDTLSRDAEQLLTIGITVNGKNYTVNTNMWNHMEGSMMMYSDPDCSQAAYVAASSVRTGALYKNTIVGDQFEKDKAYVMDSSMTESDYDSIQSQTLYAWSSRLNGNPTELTCRMVNKGEEGYDTFSPMKITPLPEGIMRSQARNSNGVTLYSYRLNGASAPFSVK